MPKLLTGLSILVTRPDQQATKLCQLIEAQDGTAVRFPAIQIQQMNDLKAVYRTLADIDQYDIGIFISSNAVDWTLKLIDHSCLTHMQLVSIGTATENCLTQKLSATSKRMLTKPIVTNSGTNSLSLLALDTLSENNVNGRKIVIFRGQGGHELLATKLSERGADVHYAEVYRRVCPVYEQHFIDSIWSAHKPDIIIVTSNNGLENLYALMSQQRRLLLNTKLVIMGTRMLDCATALGFKKSPVIVEESSEQGILNSIIKWTKTDTLQSSRNE